MEFNSTPISAITVICALAALGLYESPLNPKWIPIFCGVFGGFLGVIMLFCLTDFPLDNIFSALEAGILSGLAAVGVHQVYKQAGK